MSNDTRLDNPPAFPGTFIDHCEGHKFEKFSPGMTLRDYFAGQALAGMLQREHAYAFLDDDPTSGHTVRATTGNHARAAYNVADAMLRAREDRP